MFDQTKVPRSSADPYDMWWGSYFLKLLECRYTRSNYRMSIPTVNWILAQLSEAMIHILRDVRRFRALMTVWCGGPQLASHTCVFGYMLDNQPSSSCYALKRCENFFIWYLCLIDNSFFLGWLCWIKWSQCLIQLLKQNAQNFPISIMRGCSVYKFEWGQVGALSIPDGSRFWSMSA